MKISEFQRLIEAIYFERDSDRGRDRCFLWFVEEVGELSRALMGRGGGRENLEEEFADVFAWLSTLASIEGINLEEAVRKYSNGCPKCQATPCGC